MTTDDIYSISESVLDCELVVTEYDDTPVGRFAYNVPLIGQRVTRRNRSGNPVTFGNFLCWFASNEMLSSFFLLSPRLLPSLDETHSYDDKYKRKEGLCEVPCKGPWTPGTLLTILKRCGPLIATIDVSTGDSAGNWYPAAHAIVITGVHGADVLYNDPFIPCRRIASIGWFRCNLANQKDVVNYKKNAPYLLASGHHRHYI